MKKRGWNSRDAKGVEEECSGADERDRGRLLKIYRGDALEHKCMYIYSKYVA